MNARIKASLSVMVLLFAMGSITIGDVSATQAKSYGKNVTIKNDAC